MTRYYELGFPKITSNPTITINGDVLSGNSEAGASGIAGQFNLDIANLENEDPYESLQTMIESILTPDKGKVTINKEIGLVIVSDKKDVLDKVDKLIHKFQYFYSKQIEVEVTIISVTYDQSTTSSINWSLILPKVGENFGLAITSPSYNNQLRTPGGFLLSDTNKVKDTGQITQSLFNFLRQYGRTEIVASPRLRVTNGHSAVVMMGEVKTYYIATQTANLITSLDTNATSSNLGRMITNMDQQKYLNGILLGIVAKATNDDTIYLQVTPMISQVDENDQAKIIGLDEQRTTVPAITMREATTLLKLHNNSIAILGGLKWKTSNSNESGIPYLMDTPGINVLFKDKAKTKKTTEIAMIIRARVVY
jgi:MSHA biogenesis protein MshL